jgi:hypothetical protein
MKQSSDFCTDLISQADAFLPTITQSLYGTNSSRPTAIDSPGGRPFLYSSLVTFWILIGLTVLCTLQYTMVQTAVWRATTKVRNGEGLA